MKSDYLYIMCLADVQTHNRFFDCEFFYEKNHLIDS